MIDGLPMTGKKATNVTLAGGGNETFAALKRACLLGGYGAEFVDAASGGILADVTINLEITYDGENWETAKDEGGTDFTGVLAQAGSLLFHIVDVPKGARIRPKFVTDTTGDLVMTSYV